MSKFLIVSIIALTFLLFFMISLAHDPVERQVITMDIEIPTMVMDIEIPAMANTTTNVSIPTTNQTEAERLRHDVASTPYDVAQIKHNQFDCSDTSGIMENYLTGKGWNATILHLIHNKQDDHAMVKVYGSEKIYYVECTLKRIVLYPPDKYIAQVEYDNVLEAVEHSGYGVNEWGFETYIAQIERR